MNIEITEEEYYEVCEELKDSPFARFKPNKAGWRIACELEGMIE
jgi:hypothetical protein